METRKRCQNGYRKNRKTGECVQKNKTRSLSKIHAASKIGRFVLKNRETLRTHFLNTICADSGQCITLGQESAKIRDFFAGFVGFEYLTAIKKIGKDSTNGAIYELEYTRSGYKSYAVLKMNAIANADSLLYENWVGQHINEFSKFYPCFLETYGSYTIPKEIWTKVMRRKSATLKKRDLAEFQPGIENRIASCEYSYFKTQSLLLQHIKVSGGEETLHDAIQHPYFVKHHLATTLYQIYAVLGALSDQFTHYDLHTENVLLYKLDNNQCIQYYYYLPDGTTTSFKSKYIAKLIDYGRSYAKFPGKETPAEFHKSLCQIKRCNQPKEPCGSKYGYGWLDPTPNEYFINSTMPNRSHDLRLAYMVAEEIAGSTSCLVPLLKRVIYTTEFGTPDNIDRSEKEIRNVADMAEALRHYLPNTDNIYAYKNSQELGQIHVYLDGSRPVQYIPA